MIKNYLQFIKESFDKSREDFNSLGEWVEYLYDLYSNDEEKLSNLKNIVNRDFNNKGNDSLEDIKSDIRLSNAINLLDERVKREMESNIQDFIKNGISEKEPVITTSTDIETITESDITMAGKGIFHSFLKTLTALGQKEKSSEIERCPDNFILFYLYDNLDANSVKQVFSRFKSLIPYLEYIDYSFNELTLYYGIKCDGNFEYGVSYDGKLTPFGNFKLNQNIIKWINNLDSKSAFSLKKELVNLTTKDIILLGKIKSDMIQYNPGYHEKRLKPELKDRVMSFGYQGIGKWDNGKLDEGELMNLKNNFITWLLSKRWGDKVLISVKPSSYWLFIHIKLK